MPEYWIIDIEHRQICQCRLNGTMYDPTTITEGRIESSCIDGFGFDIAQLFAVLD